MNYIDHGVFLSHSAGIQQAAETLTPAEIAAGREKTMAYKIMRQHDDGKDNKNLHIKFDAMVSHDITYVGIIQTARASGMK